MAMGCLNKQKIWKFQKVSIAFFNKSVSCINFEIIKNKVRKILTLTGFIITEHLAFGIKSLK